jgi:uncharacterized repeat protein (TIGR01451 family)/CSLREA domain-containing protein
MGRLVGLLGCIVTAALAVSLLPATAAATTFLVTSTDDNVDSMPGDGRCQIMFSVACTLRAAVQETNASAGADTIWLSGGRILRPVIYRLTRAGAGEEEAASGDLDVKDALTITVAGGRTRGVVAVAPVIDGGALDRVFDVKIGASLTLNIVTVRNGDAGFSGDGGGILAEGELALSTATVTGNKAEEGGGVYSGGRFVAGNATFSGNTAHLRGGGIRAFGASLTRVVVTRNTAPEAGGMANLGESEISDSTFDRNTGGAIAHFRSVRSFAGGDTMTVTNSTIVANTQPAQSAEGGGIANRSQVTVSNSTIVGNSTAGKGGGLYNGGTATLSNVTLAGNAASTGGNVFTDLFLLSPMALTTSAVNTIFAGATSGGNCAGKLTSQGHNLEDGTSCALTGPGDLSNQNPMLAPLADNGGPTLTQALIPGSPAIDAGGSPCPAKDQRGVNRPAGAGCDIGAYEFAISADLTVTLAAAPAQLKIGEQVTYTATVTNKGPNSATGIALTNALPAGATLVSVRPSRGSCTSTGAVVCALGELADQATATVTIVATPTAAGTLRDSVSVRALQVDPDATNNTARADAVVTAPQTTAGGARGFTARVVSIRGRRVNGRARVRVVLVLSKPVRARASLLFRRRTLAAKTTSLKAGRRTTTLAARRRSGRGRYVLRIVLSDAQKNRSVLTLRVVLR